MIVHQGSQIADRARKHCDRNMFLPSSPKQKPSVRIGHCRWRLYSFLFSAINCYELLFSAIKCY